MSRSHTIAIIVIVGGVVTLGALVASASFLLDRSGLCVLTIPIDRKFGDQHLKTTVALLELYKTRHGRYPDRLADLDFTGDWDRIALSVVAYHPNETRTGYYVEVTRGWLCAPRLDYPDTFWSGTGYHASLKP